MSVDNLDLNSQETPRKGREERKHLNSSVLNETLDLDNSNDQRNFETRNFGHEDDRYENYQSLRYGDNSLESSSPNFKQQFPLTRTSGFHNGTNTSGFIESDGEFSNFDEEGEESEFEESDEYNQEEYIRRTDGSTDENYSLAEHTKTQFIENKELTEVMRHKRGIDEQSHNQFTGSNFKYNEDDEYEEEEEESDINIDSQISGYDSLSQTHKSKVSSKGFRKSGRVSRNRNDIKTGHFAQNQTVSSQYNESDSKNKYDEGTDSIGLKMRNDRNNETMSIDQSNESWGAITPRDPLVAPRTLKDSHQLEYFHSPDGRSLIIDESVMHEKAGQKASQGTDGDYSRSNLYENSEGQDPQTIGRSRKLGKKIKKAKKRRENNKNNSLARISGNLPRDFELEQAFSDNVRDRNNYINLNQEEIGENLESTPDYNQVNEMEFKKIKYENRELKSKNQYELAKEILEKKKNEAHDLSSKLFEEERISRELSDKLNLLNDVNKGVNKAKIKDLTNEKLKRSRQENKQLKEENRDLEEKLEQYHYNLMGKRGMEEHYMKEISNLELALETFKIKDSVIAKNKEQISSLVAQIQQLKHSQDQIIRDANDRLEDLSNELNS
jgi:hypothetical protein